MTIILNLLFAMDLLNVIGIGLLHDEIDKMSLCYRPYIHILQIHDDL